ncbi:multiple PDZ domain protein-like isoform X2 [Acanthaster planci]|uniref:Multiple PDZ domain protein-like isoform X2 n=1 Tax=Acanthaster planci TaxID=133434 RepID=A0A8B7YI50_ACAPL|nr:multiple PDZ domain protein-like isoform X2 [Acanthaster planci]
MALVADTKHAVELLHSMQNELQRTGDMELDQELSDMITMMESPLFTQLLTLQQSVRQLRDHVESTPPGQPVGEFDFTPSGELVLQELSKPELESSTAVQPAHPYAYENQIDLEDEAITVQSATAEQSAPPPASQSEADEVDTLLESIAELAMGREVRTIKLMKPEKGGLGFSVVGLKSENHGELGIFVQQVQPNGVAADNGELQESDQILAINGHLLDASVSHQQAIVMLQHVKGLVELVVARGVFQIPVNANGKIGAANQNKKPQSGEEAVHSGTDGEVQHSIEQIDLYNDGSGLGFGIVGVHDVGIMVKTILPGGTADRDGRLQSGDIILQIGETPLQGMTSDQVAMVLKQAGSHVHLTVARGAFSDQESSDTKPEPMIQMQQTSEVHSEPPSLYSKDEPDGVNLFDVVLEKGAEGLGITIAGYVRDLGTGQVSGIFVKKIAEGSAADLNGQVQVNDQIIEVDGQSLEGFTNIEAVDLLRNTGSIVHIKLARHPPGTLDISNVSMDHPSIAAASVAEGPVEPQHIDNEEEAPPIAPPAYPPPAGVILMDSQKAETPKGPFEGKLDPEVEASLVDFWQGILGMEVTIVVAQLSKFREGGGLGISLEGTVDIDEAGEEVRPHHYIRSILPDGPVGQNGRLQSGDELLEVNGDKLLGLNHVDVVKTLKELPMHVRIVCARHPHPVFPESQVGEVPQLASVPPQDGPSVVEEVVGASEVSLRESVPFPEVAVPGVGGGSGDTAISPLPRESVSGLAVWDDQLQTVELVKGDRGLGFSILDYQDPLNPSKTVIVIRSLVAGGVAEQDGRLIPGDRLVFVNDTNLDNCSLEMAVQALKGAPQGPVRLQVAKPLPQPVGDTALDGEEPVIMAQQMSSVHQAPPSGFQGISAHTDELLQLQEMQNALEESHKSPSPETVPSGPIVEEVVVSASVATDVEASMDLNQILNDQPETAPTTTNTSPPDLVLASSATVPASEPVETVTSTQETAVKSSLLESKRQPPPLPPKPSPRNSGVTAEALSESSDPPVTAVPTSLAIANVPLGKRASVVLPNSLEKTINLKKGNAGLGLTVIADKSNGVVVKSIIRGGAVHHDGRLAVGDYITSVNGNSMRGLSNVEARAILRRASLAGDEISMTYIPASDAAAFREDPSAFSSVSPTDDKFALPLKDQHSDSVKLAAVALSPVSVAAEGDSAQEVHTVRLTKEPNKSLGISIVGVTNRYGRAGDGQPVEGIYIKHVLDDSPAGRTGALKTGDRILEVNGCDLRDASHDYAVAIIRNAASPVCFMVQSLSPGDHMPSGKESVIPPAEEEVVAMVTEETKTAPTSLEEASSTQMVPLSPIKHKLSLSGSENEEDQIKDGSSNEVDSAFAGIGGEILVIQLAKSSRGLGISLAGNRDRSKRSVFVVGVDPDGAAAQDKRLQIADEILSINGVSVYGKSHQKASAIIKDIPKDGDVQLIVRRHPQAIDQLAVTPLTPTPADKQRHFQLPDLTQSGHDFSSYPNVHSIIINKGVKGLGFAVFEKPDSLGKCGIFVRDITRGGAAHEEGSLRSGDQILSVDSNNLVDTKKNEAIVVLKGTKGQVILTVSSEQPFIQPQPTSGPTQVERRDEPVEDVVVTATVGEEQCAPPSLPEESLSENLAAGHSIKEEKRTIDQTNVKGAGADELKERRDETGNKERSTEGGIAVGKEEKETRKEKEKSDKIIQSSVAEKQESEPAKEVGGLDKVAAPDLLPTESASVPVVTSHPASTPDPVPTLDPAPITAPEPTITRPDPLTCPVMPGEPTDIIIDKGKTGLGLSIVGGTDTQLSIVVVHEVYEHGAAARDGRLWPGDQLIQVNGIDLTNIKHDGAIAALRQSPSQVCLRVFRDQQSMSQGAVDEEGEEPEVEEEEKPEDEYDEMLSVELRHTRGRSLGLNVVGKTSGRGVVISMILRGSAAHAEGSLKAGDHILSINGKDVQNATREEVASLLKSSDGHVLFEIGRKKDLGKTGRQEEPAPRAKSQSPAQVRHVELRKIPGESLGLSIAGGKGSDMGDMPLIIASINPGSQADRNKQLKVLDCIESINGRSVAGLSYASAINLLKNSQGVIQLDVSELNPSTKDWYLRYQRTSSGGEGMVAVKASVKPQSTVPIGTVEETSACRLKHIELQRGPDGLGFSIIGGYGSPHGDLPIYIKTVFNKGAAAVSGELKRGDQIMAVNGESLESATHEQAVEVLKRAKGKVVITILA